MVLNHYSGAILCHFLMTGNWIHIQITFPFLTVRFLLFQNSSDPDVHSSDPSVLFQRGARVNFISSTTGWWRDWKIKKGWKYGVGAGLLKSGHFSYFIFSRFIIFTFRNYFTLCKIVLYTFAKLSYAFEENCFFLPPYFWEKNLFKVV